ncbi:nitrile hydratase [Roseococcus sp. DSY-14]|uniref:nitrile hydratase n=1 Tax=Roseococcus sp. DSY-14 TaxID=3369650 RepID=UPI00387B6E22
MTDLPLQHDLGGHPRFRCTAVEPADDAPPSAFDKRVDAVRALLREKGLFTVDEMRLNIERLHETEYFGLTYYEKWLRSVVAVMVAKGVVTWEDLA